ncbi:hypothetical protein AVEN_194488-1 [Araneus ventricosus]|uniref:Uncharacterized protein n=1 Tax=Araneus ventricosus TaxID=182803 RepID=A0A4Y2A760_ARAVE|nr:hypothetical protein AVEN_194488-1 [Araneus ventricosus]
MDLELSQSLPIRKLYSLKDIALLSFALFICNLNKLRNLCADMNAKLTFQGAPPHLNFKFELSKEYMLKLKSESIIELQNYRLPQEFNEKVTKLICPLYSIVNQFLHNNPALLDTTIDLRKIIVLSNDGSINQAETQRKIMMNPNLSNNIRFASACAVCSVKNIAMLWNNMSESELEFYKTASDKYNVYTPPLVMLWRDFLLNGKVDWPSNDEFFQYAPHFEGAYYIINKLDLKLREEKIAKCFEYALLHHIDLDIWLERMDERQKTELIQSNAIGVLRSYLEWPRAIYLTNVANLLWQFIKPHDFVDFLWLIYDRIITEYGYYDYLNAALEFLDKCPDDYWNHGDVAFELNCLSDNLRRVVEKRNLKKD